MVLYLVSGLAAGKFSSKEPFSTCPSRGEHRTRVRGEAL
jgi:hypothetical protein